MSRLRFMRNAASWSTSSSPRPFRPATSHHSSAARSSPRPPTSGRSCAIRLEQSRVASARRVATCPPPCSTGRSASSTSYPRSGDWPRTSRGHTPDNLDPRLRPGGQLIEHLVAAPARTFKAWLREDAPEEIALEVGVEGGAVTEEIDPHVGAAFGIGDPDLRQQPVDFGEDGRVVRVRGRELVLARVVLVCDDQCFHRTSLGL